MHRSNSREEQVVTTTSMRILNDGALERKERLVEKIGGQKVLRDAVDKFYSRLVTDPRLASFFEHANLTILKWHQFNIMSIAFTHVPYDNFDVNELILTKHRWLFEDYGLNETHYDIVLEHFHNTLSELGVGEATIQEAQSTVTPLREVFAQGAKQARQRKQIQRNQRRALLSTAIIGIMTLIAIRAVKRNKY